MQHLTPLFSSFLGLVNLDGTGDPSNILYGTSCVECYSLLVQICVLLILACSLTSVHGLGAPLDGLLDGDVTLAARTDDEDLALDADVSGSVCMDFESIFRKMHLDWLLGSLRSVIKTLFGSMRPCCHCDWKSIPKFYKALDGVERSMKSVPSAGNLLIALKSVRRCVENKCSKKAPLLRSLFKMLSRWRAGGEQEQLLQNDVTELLDADVMENSKAEAGWDCG